MRWANLKIEHLSLLAAVVIAFAALAALILTGQAGIREDLRASHAALLAGQVELRKDIRAVETELRKDMRAGQAELRKDIRAGQAELRKDLRAVEAELRAGQEGIRKDLKSLEVRLAVVEQRTAGLSGEPDASVDRPAPAASPDGRHQSTGATLLVARAVIAPFWSLAADGSTY